MVRKRFRLWRWLLGGLAGLLFTGSLAIAAFLVLLDRRLDQSLPITQGTASLAGLRRPVTLERDDLGTVTIRSDDPRDEARALGFVQGQERFFQMDLLRRSAAGELAALLGSPLLDLDLDRRRHRLRATATATAAALTPDQRAIFSAYTDGLNAGLASLGAAPFEYFLLQTKPVAWRVEDCFLVIASIYFDMQGGSGRDKLHEWQLRQVVPPAVGDFLYPKATTWDAPLQGEPAPAATVPGPDLWDWRKRPPTLARQRSLGTFDEPGRLLAGSNQWAVAGHLTATGQPIVANDMHLGLGMPGIWFRVALERGGRRVAGVALPGIPAIVSGSNGDIAWSLTNAPGDNFEVLLLDLDPNNPQRYRTPTGWQTLERIAEKVTVRFGRDRTLVVEQTIWGPVLGRLPDGTPYAVRWVAHDPAGYNPAYLHLAAARTVDEAVTIAQQSGVPTLNFVAADRAGDLAWTILGRVPRRARPSELATRSSAGSTWDGWLEPGAYPVIRNPASGRLWTANARVVDGASLALVGDYGYALGARGRQIRDRLLTDPIATPADHLAIQLDTEARFLARWREQLLSTLDDDAVASDPRFGPVREAVEQWGGHASIDSVGYRLVRGWRRAVMNDLQRSLEEQMKALGEKWRYDDPREEEWVWPIFSTEPAHLLDPRHASWRAFRLTTLTDLLENMDIQKPAQVAERTWGSLNTVRLQHPLATLLPFLGRLTDLPPRPLPGDNHMPLVQSRSFGASQRSVVSPGNEEDGLLHLPGGPSGHPRSPFYGAGTPAWEEGRPSPFLPGEPTHVLQLQPTAGRK